MSANPSVAVIILSWNGSKLLQRFLPSVVQFSTYSPLRIIVADNGSTDNSEVVVKQFAQKVEWLSLGKNYGFAQGYNEAIHRVNADYIVLLNQDVEVTANWIEPIIKLMEADKLIASVQPKIKSVDNPLMFEYAGAAGGWMDKYGYPFCRGRIFDSIEDDKGQYDDDAEIAWASGACMFVRKELFEKAGGLDADLFAHMEEIDLCWRLKNEGYKIMYSSASTVYHLGGASLPQGNPFKVYLNFRNSLIILFKNTQQGKLLSTFFIRLILDKVAAWRALFSGNFSNVKAITKAWFHFLKSISKWKRKRSELLKLTSSPNRKGFYNGSIALKYFVVGAKVFTDIEKHS